MQAEISYPYRVEHKANSGTFYVTVYHAPIKPKTGPRAGITQDAYRLIWWERGERKRQSFTDAGKALKAAKEIAKNISGEGRTLSVNESRVYDTALDMIRETGLNLDTVCTQFANVWKLTAGKVEAAGHYYADRDESAMVNDRPLADMVKEYLAARAAAKNKDKKGNERPTMSPHYFRDYAAKLNALSEAFPLFPMSYFEPYRVSEYISKLGMTTRTLKNARSIFLRFFKWAQERHYIAAKYDFNKVEEITVVHSEIEYFTIDEIKALLKHADDSMRAHVAIGAFSGLRYSEIVKLDWKNVNFEEGHIRVRLDNKTNKGRLVPIQPNLREWLAPLRQASGRVQRRDDPGEALRWLGKKAGVPWKGNGLRHSYGTYRTAQVKNKPQVAFEMGNTVGMLEKHYLELVTEKLGKEWFNVLPPSAPATPAEPAEPTTNIVQMPVSATKAA